MIVSQPIRGLQPGVQYTMSAYVKTQNVSGSDGSATISLSFKKADGGYGGHYPSGFGGTRDWARVAGTFIPQPGEKDFSIMLLAAPEMGGDPPPTGRAWFE